MSGKNYVRKRLPRFSAAWWAKFTTVDETTGCILWSGSTCKQGYGRVWFGGRSGVPVHRAAYEVARGPFDPSLVVCHKCDVRNCVNLDHLFLGTQTDNLRDMFAKGRARPRGRAPGWRKRAAVVASTLSQVNGHKCVGDNYLVHLISTSAMTAPWCRVIGTPRASDASKVPLEKRPKWWTVILPAGSSTVSDSRNSGAELSVSSSLRRSESGQ